MTFKVLQHGTDAFGRKIIEYELNGVISRASVTDRAEQAVNKGENKDLVLFQFVDPETVTVRILGVEADISDIEAKGGFKIDSTQIQRFKP